MFNFLNLGCDGLWEHSNINENLNEMYEFMNKMTNDEKSTRTLSESLVYKAQEFGSGDNITAIVVSLKKFKKPI